MKQYIDKSALVAEIERRKQTWQHQDQQYVNGGKDVCDYLLGFIDSIEEEPVSKDLEEAARKAATWHSKIKGDVFFANDYQKFIKGAKWQKERMVKKACEWLKSYRQDTPDGTGYIPGIINDETIEDFKQAMNK